MKFWVTEKGYGTVFVSEDKTEAQRKYEEWCDNCDYEVTLWADLDDGNGAVIWKRH